MQCLKIACTVECARLDSGKHLGEGNVSYRCTFVECVCTNSCKAGIILCIGNDLVVFVNIVTYLHAYELLTISECIILDNCCTVGYLHGGKL